MIRTFIEQEKLGIRVTRTTTNEVLLDMIENQMQKQGEEPEPQASAETDETPVEEPAAAQEGVSEEPAPRRRR